MSPLWYQKTSALLERALPSPSLDKDIRCGSKKVAGQYTADLDSSSDRNWDMRNDIVAAQP